MAKILCNKFIMKQDTEDFPRTDINFDKYLKNILRAIA